MEERECLALLLLHRLQLLGSEDAGHFRGLNGNLLEEGLRHDHDGDDFLYHLIGELARIVPLFTNSFDAVNQVGCLVAVHEVEDNLDSSQAIAFDFIGFHKAIDLC